jgi:hypothetical protein
MHDSITARGGPDKAHVRQAVSLGMVLEEPTEGTLGHPCADQAHVEHVRDPNERNYMVVPQVLPRDGLTPEGLASNAPIRNAWSMRMQRYVLS